MSIAGKKLRNMKDKIYFYVGIIQSDKMDLNEFINNMIEDSDQKYFVEVMKEYEDPQGYYTYQLRGSWEAYKCFMNRPFVKSLTHDED
jgi:AAA+ ATPase superfamily predicted ATPase